MIRARTISRVSPTSRRQQSRNRSIDRERRGCTRIRALIGSIGNSPRRPRSPALRHAPKATNHAPAARTSPDGPVEELCARIALLAHAAAAVTAAACGWMTERVGKYVNNVDSTAHACARAARYARTLRPYLAASRMRSAHDFRRDDRALPGNVTSGRTEIIHLSFHRAARFVYPDSGNFRGTMF